MRARVRDLADPAFTPAEAAAGVRDVLMTDEEIRQQARGEWQRDGEIEIDAAAIVSRSEDGGAYVAAWVWIDCEHGGEPEGGEPEGGES